LIDKFSKHYPPLQIESGLSFAGEAAAQFLLFVSLTLSGCAGGCCWAVEDGEVPNRDTGGSAGE
jgi:hypothetical protein